MIEDADVAYFRPVWSAFRTGVFTLKMGDKAMP
jgi:hypothetical protein